MIDWKRKLTSRKFWAAVAGFVTGLLVYIQSPDKTPESIGGLIVLFGSLVAYIIGEGVADAGHGGDILISPSEADYFEEEEDDEQ